MCLRSSVIPLLQQSGRFIPAAAVAAAAAAAAADATVWLRGATLSTLAQQHADITEHVLGGMQR